MEPARAARRVRGAAPAVRESCRRSVDLIVSPALGRDRARLRARPAARRDGAVRRAGRRAASRSRRGFAIAPGSRVLIAEDVVTTGLSTRECMACCRAEGGEVVAAACLIDRSGGRAAARRAAGRLAALDLPTYPPDQLPPELAAIPR